MNRRVKVKDPEELLSVPEVAAWLRVSPWTVREWTYSGAFVQPIKLGTGRSAPVRYRRGDVQAWLDERAAASASR